jgi:hypothetical protein
VAVDRHGDIAFPGIAVHWALREQASKESSSHSTTMRLMESSEKS